MIDPSGLEKIDFFSVVTLSARDLPWLETTLQAPLKIPAMNDPQLLTALKIEFAILEILDCRGDACELEVDWSNGREEADDLLINVEIEINKPFGWLLKN